MKKATITKETLKKLYRISDISKIMYFERNVRLSAFTGTMRYGTTLTDLDDDFKIPINTLPLFISMIETAMGKGETVDIEYDVQEKDFGLDVKKLWTVSIKSATQHIVFYTSDSEDFEDIIVKDLGDKSKNPKISESHMRFNLSSEVLKVMDKNCKILNADTIEFRNEGDDVICKIWASNIPDSPITEIKVEGTSFANADDFPFSVKMFDVIDKNIDYDVVINCDKNAILFANEADGTFYISSRKK